jgi:hypothetical protein
VSAPSGSALSPASALAASTSPGASDQPNGTLALEGTVPAPTDPTIVPGSQNTGACTFIGINPHVVGSLEVDPSDPTWPIHIRTLTGRVVYVLWPAGFRVRFAPLQLIDERGLVISTGSISLDQVALTKSGGTKADPYRATGLFANRCYVTASPSP